MIKKYILLGFIVVLVSTSIFLSHKSTVATCIRNDKNIVGVVLGTDYVDYSVHSDTIIFFCYNPIKKILDIISIPRDTKIDIPALKLRRINEVYAYYYRKDKNYKTASEGLIKNISLLFNNQVTIPYYLQINYNLFYKFIDTFNGIRIEIDEPMNYDDNAGNLHIHFQPGTYVLNGHKALEYVRYRNVAGDIGRITRQQRFIKALIYKLVNPVYIIRLPLLLKFAINDMHTNLSFWDMANLFIEIKNINIKNIRMAQLPGNPHGVLWVKDDKEIEHIIDIITNGNQTSKDVNSFILTDKNIPVRIQVFNASSIDGAALELAEKLRQHEFDVIDYGNYPAVQKKSQIIDMVGNLVATQKIGKLLNIDEIYTRYDSHPMADIKIIIGEDYKKIE